jgi:hypothetical protein
MDMVCHHHPIVHRHLGGVQRHGHFGLFKAGGKYGMVFFATYWVFIDWTTPVVSHAFDPVFLLLANQSDISMDIHRTADPHAGHRL